MVNRECSVLVRNTQSVLEGVDGCSIICTNTILLVSIKIVLLLVRTIFMLCDNIIIMSQFTSGFVISFIC